MDLEQDQSKRLYRHFACIYTYSNGAACKGTLHVLGEHGWEVQKATLLRRAGSPVPPPAPTPPSSAGRYLGVGGGHWIRRHHPREADQTRGRLTLDLGARGPDQRELPARHLIRSGVTPERAAYSRRLGTNADSNAELDESVAALMGAL